MVAYSRYTSKFFHKGKKGAILGHFVFSPVLGRDQEVIAERTSLQGSMSLAELMLMLLVL